MREYDGREKRYKKSDQNIKKNLDIIENLLGFRPFLEQLDFDLSFYSGGTGVDDSLTISCEASPSQIEKSINKLHMYSPEQAVKESEWREDFLWLVAGEDECSDILISASSFINEIKENFQDSCFPNNKMYFSFESNVNSYTVIWIIGKKLNYIYFDQG